MTALPGLVVFSRAFAALGASAEETRPALARVAAVAAEHRQPLEWRRPRRYGRGCCPACWRLPDNDPTADVHATGPRATHRCRHCGVRWKSGVRWKRIGYRTRQSWELVGGRTTPWQGKRR